MAHQSRPGRADFTDLSQHAIRLSEILGRPVEFVNDICGPVAVDAIRTLQPGGVLVLDNIRMHPDEINLKGEIKHQEESEIVRVLRPHFDLFVNDAFGAAHRSSPSLTGFTRVLPSVAGSLMKDEIDALSIAIENPLGPMLRFSEGQRRTIPCASHLTCWRKTWLIVLHFSEWWVISCWSQMGTTLVGSMRNLL